MFILSSRTIEWKSINKTVQFSHVHTHTHIHTRYTFKYVIICFIDLYNMKLSKTK